MFNTPGTFGAIFSVMSVPCKALRKINTNQKPLSWNGNLGNTHANESFGKYSSHEFFTYTMHYILHWYIYTSVLSKHRTFDSNTSWVLSYDLHTLQRMWAGQPRHRNVPDPFRAVIKWRPDGSGLCQTREEGEIRR